MLRSDCLALHQRLSIEARRGVLVKVVMSFVEQEQIAERTEQEKKEEQQSQMERTFSIDSDYSPMARGSRSSTSATVAPEYQQQQQYQSLYAYTALPTYGTAILNAAHAERQAINFRTGKVTPVSSLRASTQVANGNSDTRPRAPDTNP